MLKNFRSLLNSKLLYLQSIKTTILTVKYQYSIQDKYRRKMNQLVDDGSNQHQKIEYDEQIFENQEQKIGIELLNCRENQQIIDIYTRYSKDTLLSFNSLAMMVYFMGKSKADLEDVQQIVHDIVKCKDQKVEYHVFSTLCSGLANINKRDEQYPQELQDLVKHKMKELVMLFETHNCIVLVNSIQQIIEDKEDLLEIFKMILKRFIQDLETADINYLITMVQQISLLKVKIEQNIVDGFQIELNQICQQLVKRNSDLEFSQIIAILDNLMFIEHYNLELIETMFIRLIDLQFDDPNDVARTLQASVDLIGQDNIVRTILKKIIQLKEFISGAGYSDMWGIVAKLYHKQSLVNKKVIVGLKQMVLDRQLNLKELDVFQKSNILVCASITRLDDFAFIGFFQKLVKEDLRVLDNQQLVNLARVSVVYVKEHDEFMVRLHDELVQRIEYLSRQDKSYLIDTFKRCSILFPQSPFLV